MGNDTLAAMIVAGGKGNEPRETDLLFGITSHAESGMHYFLADFDDVTLDELMRRAMDVLFSRGMGNVYVVRSGRTAFVRRQNPAHEAGHFHLLEFTTPLTIDRYVDLLREMGACPNFIRWVDMVKYGVLRTSRRSGHLQVPRLVRVLANPECKMQENTARRNLYLMLLCHERDIEGVRRVIVDDKKRKDIL